jgi:hypothetical protein
MENQIDPYTFMAWLCFGSIPMIFFIPALLHTIRWMRAQRKQRNTFRALDRRVNL